MEKKYKYYPLSHPQKRIWYSELMMSESGILNLMLTLKSNFDLDFNILEAAINILVKNHDTMRIRLANIDGEIKQYFQEYNTIKIDFYDFTDKKKQEELFMAKITNKAFSIYNSKLFYFAMIKYADGKCGFLIKTHHIISDAYTYEIMCRYIMDTYKEIKSNNTTDNSNIVSYKSFLKNENEYLKSLRFEKDRLYWLDKFKSKKDVLPAMMITDYKSKRIIMYFEKSLTDKLFSFCKSNMISNFNLIISCIMILFSKLCSIETVIIGTTTHNRTKPEEKKMLGMFVNTIPIFMNINTNNSFKDLLTLSKTEIAGNFRHQKFPYDLLIKELQKQDKSVKGLFDVIFTYENVKLQLENEMHHHGNDFFPLSIHVTEREMPLLRAEIDYNISLYNEEEIKTLYNCLIRIIEQVIEHPDILISQIELLHPRIKQKLITEYNNTESNYFKEKSITAFFSEQVKKRPDRIAVKIDNNSLTYKELDSLSDKAACFLISKGIKKNSIVGIDLKRSFEMIISILGILKTGAAYLPLEPDFPLKRKELLLKDSRAEILLTDDPYVKSFLPVYRTKDILDNEYNPDMLPESIPSDNTAYIIYTSGSTGKPKGTLISNYNVTRVVKNTNYIEINNNDIFLQISNYAFDGSVFDIFGALLNGCTLILLRKNQVMNIDYIAETIIREKISVFFITTVLFNTLIDTNIKCLKKIRHILFGGEKVSKSHVEKAFDYLGPGKMIHVYGPTESTVFATYFKINNIPEYTDTIPIGKPISNTRAYVVNKYDELLPPGFTGELYLGGDGISKGYLNLPELTNNKFTEDPFLKGSVIYKTGDTVKMFPDGNIEFIGRIDDQVKIRGHRIEPGEIESALRKHPEIKNAVITVKEHNKTKYLCSYLITKDHKPIKNINIYLLSVLPDYSVPDHYIYLKSFPLNQNGKIDKNNLPKPDFKNENNSFEEPETEHQKLLSEIWQEVLKTEKVGINDNFYHIGGDSIKAIQISSKLHSRNYKVNTSAILKYPTIKTLSKHIKQLDNQPGEYSVNGNIKLTPIQKMFFNYNPGNFDYFNQVVIISLEKDINTDTLYKVLMILSDHHDVMRMRYKDGKQTSLEKGTVNFKIAKRAVKDDLENFIEYMQNLINIENGPLFIVGTTCINKTIKIIFSIHHLIIDGISWRILLDDFFSLYESIEEKRDISLPHKTTSFMDWSRFLYRHSTSDMLLHEYNYWKKILTVEGVNKISGNTGNNPDIKTATFSLSQSDTEYLLSGIHKSYNTGINDILLTALCISLSNTFRINSSFINLESHGREQLDKNINISRTIGWFTTAFPVILAIDKDKELFYNIVKVKEELRKIPNNGIGFGILKYLTPETLIDKKIFNICPEISFNFLGSMNNSSIEIESINFLKKDRKLFFYPLNINSVEIKSVFSVFIEYDNSRFEENDIEKFCTTYKQTLLDIIKHCRSVKSARSSPSDFGDRELSFNELDNIRNIINNIDN